MPPFGPSHTIILLHGRGSNGEEFAEGLESKRSTGRILQEQLPTCDAQDWQMDGICHLVRYLTSLLEEEETEKLGGATQWVVLGGISQGGAVAMWTLVNDAQVTAADAFVGAMTASARRNLYLQGASETVGVPIESTVQKTVSLSASLREYSGAEEEGHWLKEPEEFGDVLYVLESTFTSM
ncbi:acyl-protein thioesterase 1 [Achaetomium macrosporum]|uniref:Acyl-protein thioesterase 1 n=1 Tax=Achaetomium macrosporum TaxID=79813 RepID=A0AAN7C7Q2_9PEZI|nr:acyl-protein thioesterase 1 [Achaetomium macrosporum]